VVVRLVVVGVVVVVVVLLRCPAASSLVGTQHEATAKNRLMLNNETANTSRRSTRQVFCPVLRMTK